MSGTLSVFASPGRYVQGRDATAALGEQLQAAGLKGPVLILFDKVIQAALEPVWAQTLPASGYEYTTVQFGGECTVAEIDALAAAGRDSGAATVIGVGGGKVLDTARAAADALGVPAVNCPTAASCDAPTSALSVVYTKEGAVDHYKFYRAHPALVLVDTSVISRAPKRLLVAGMGDALATWFEARAASNAFHQTMLHGGATRAGVALAELCYRTLLADGPAACTAVEVGAITPSFERIVEANTLLSGLGFECGGLSVAHAVHNGLTQAPGSHAYLHGEKVAFGTLTQLVLEGRPSEEVQEVMDFCFAVGLPLTLAQIGVDVADRKLLAAVASRAVDPGETSHTEPFTVTAQAVLDAMVAADHMGSKRLAAAGK